MMNIIEMVGDTDIIVRDDANTENLNISHIEANTNVMKGGDVPVLVESVDTSFFVQQYT